MSTPKEVTKQLIDYLPDHAGWDDIMYELYVGAACLLCYIIDCYF